MLLIQLIVNTVACRCTECMQTNNACGWCTMNKLCRGTNNDCMNSSNFLQVTIAKVSIYIYIILLLITYLFYCWQLMDGQTFQDVCPLLLNINNGYTQHIRVTTDLQLNTDNLLNPVKVRVVGTKFRFILYC